MILNQNNANVKQPERKTSNIGIVGFKTDPSQVKAKAYNLHNGKSNNNM